MIALIGNRPVLQVGRHQVPDYDTAWLGRALQRAARAADLESFPFIDEIREGIEEYLESRCALELLPLTALYARLRQMLETIGCASIADKLEPVAPPVTLCLAHAARRAGNGFELAFFQQLRSELEELREAGVEEIHFVHLRESIQLLCGVDDWKPQCDRLLGEIRSFIEGHDRGLALRRQRLRVEGDSRLDAQS